MNDVFVEDKLHKQHCLEASAEFQLKNHSIRIILPLKLGHLTNYFGPEGICIRQ